MTLAVAIAFVGGGAAAARANLVQVGNFAADTITVGNPSVTPPTGWSATGNAGVDSAFPTGSDANDAFIGTGSLSQALTTSAGTNYTISFFVGVDDFNLASDSAATFGSTDLFGGTPISPPSALSYGGYTEFTGTATASGTRTTITFTGSTNSGDGTFDLADVDVEPLSSAIPEPATMLVRASALAGIGLVRRRAA
jgi:hypothetical protein